jgi:glycine/D-amino acid oxidase-like deaminating enzyme
LKLNYFCHSFLDTQIRKAVAKTKSYTESDTLVWTFCHFFITHLCYPMVAVSKIVIAGGGIIGTSVAYFIKLFQPDTSVILVDPVGIAPGASAKAGGFLAKEWRDGTPLEPMQRLGFDLHEQLADDLGSERIGYRRLNCHNVYVDNVENEVVTSTVKWADLNVVGTVSMGTEDVIAQVHPRKLCEAMWEEASKNSGAELRQGRIVKALSKKVSSDGDPAEFEITGVELEDGSKIDADVLVVACGPWTEEARSWFPSSTQRLPQITSVKCHSMLVKPKSEEVLDQAVFFESYDDDILLETAGLEVYPRPDGDCYVNGFEGAEVIITERPGQEEVDLTDIELMKEAMRQTSTELGGVEPHTTQVSSLIHSS